MSDVRDLGGVSEAGAASGPTRSGVDRPDRPLVSVIIPTFRREQQLVRAIESALAQDLPSLEVLVLDDSPEGSAAAAVAGFDTAVVTYEQMATPSGGVPALVRNHGIGRASGRYLYFLDDDDQVAPGGLTAMVAALEADRRAAVAYGRVRCVGPDQGVADGYNRWFSWARDAGARTRRSRWLTTGVIMFRGTTIINSACMIRRDAAVALGGYDPSLAVYEDVEFFTRGIRRYGHVFVDHDVLIYSTGLPSLIHDLEGDNGPISASYERFHAKYRIAHGRLDYRLLQVVSKALPLGGPPLD